MEYVRAIEEVIWIDEVQMPSLRELLRVINDNTYVIIEMILVLKRYLTILNTKLKIKT